MITSYIKFPNAAPSVVGAELSLIDSTNVSVPVLVFASTTTGVPSSRTGGGTGQNNAITTIALCNTAAVTLSDETANAVIVNIYLVKKTSVGFAVTNIATPGTGNLIVSNLTVPAGETVFFADERLVLDANDELWVGTSSAARLAVTISSLPV
jgi:hypothetical protein